jgi:hypothetical protein
MKWVTMDNPTTLEMLEEKFEEIQNDVYMIDKLSKRLRSKISNFKVAIVYLKKMEN